MALLSVIRRWHLRDKISIREIARRTKLSRNTTIKYLTSGETSPRYPHRKSPSQLDAYTAELSDWLRTNQRQSRKQRRTMRQMHATLPTKGSFRSGSRDSATLVANPLYMGSAAKSWNS